jgi:glycosyltransferase involved in cell wall biosynthesis
MSSRKILFVADAKSVHTAKWVDYFVNKGYEVHLATFSAYNQTQCTNVYYLSNASLNVKGGNYHYLLHIVKLANLLKKIRPDYINAHFSYSMGFITLLAKVYAKVSSEFSVVCHGSDVLNPPNRYIFDKVNRFVLSRADKVFAVSDQITDKLMSLGIESEKVLTGQYGVQVKYDQHKKDIDIISNRAYNANSRIDFLLEALSHMDTTGLMIVFVLPNITDVEYNKLVKKYPFVRFYKALEYNEMIEFVSRAKIYVSATLSDGTSLSLLESMKLECIPIVSNIVSNRSWVLDGINGYLFKTQQEFLSKMNNALSVTFDDEMIQINKKLLQQKGDYNKQMEKVENFLMERM